MELLILTRGKLKKFIHSEPIIWNN